jgi:pimeloyl-ACP methyl ester carboxylesterase
MHAASTMPNAEVTVIPRAGHLPLYEQPGCVAAALSQFSQRLDRVPEVAG